MTHPPSEPDCLQAEFVPAEEPDYASDRSPADLTEIAVTQTTESALATLEPTLQATDSFEFNYVDRPAAPSPASSEPQDASDVLTRLFTPWSLGGLFLLVLANGLLTVHSFARHTAPTPVAISGFGELPPVTSIPPGLPNAAHVPLSVDRLSEVTLPQSTPSPALVTAQAPAVPPPPSSLPPAAQSALPLPPPPPTVSLASRLLPPAINPQQAMMPPPSSAPPGGYPTYATARANAPQPPQPPNGFPTVAVRPVHQPQPISPLPPPPPPPLGPAAIAPGIAPPIAPSMESAPLPNPPSPAANTAQNVELQMRQQLPTHAQPSPPKPYNQSPGATTMGSSPTQQLVQELESLNQAP